MHGQQNIKATSKLMRSGTMCLAAIHLLCFIPTALSTSNNITCYVVLHKSKSSVEGSFEFKLRFIPLVLLSLTSYFFFLYSFHSYPYLSFALKLQHGHIFMLRTIFRTDSQLTLGRIHSMKMDKSPIERVEEFKYLGTTFKNQNLFRKKLRVD